MLGQSPLNTSPLNFLPARETQVIGYEHAQVWRLKVVIGGIDYSSRLTGVCSVEAEEGGSRICTLSILPTPGVMAPDAWTGARVVLSRQRFEGESVQSETVWFSGNALRPSWDTTSRVITLVATCNRQRRIADMSTEQVAAMIPGRYSVGVFGEISDSESYAADMLSTIPFALDCDAFGSLRLTPWAASPIERAFLSASDIVDGSLSLELAESDQLVNSLELTLEYRYQRLRHREYSFFWDHPAGSFCPWLADSTELPTLSMLNDALEQANWQTRSINYVALPASMPNPCDMGGAWINRYTDDPHLLSFDARVSTRSAQTLTEIYKLTLTAPGSVAAFSRQASTERFSDVVDYDGGAWEEADGGRPAGSQQDEIGDWIIDEDEGDRRDAFIRTSLAVGECRILSAHRQNRVRFKALILDDVYDLNHTLKVRALGVVAKGKVVWMRAEWDHDSGTALIDIALSVSRAGAESHVISTLPARPVFEFGARPSANSRLATQIGGRYTSEPFDEELDGFAGNYGITSPGVERYPRRLQITTPDVAEAHRDPAEATRNHTYTIAVPNDLLLIEVI